MEDRIIEREQVIETLKRVLPQLTRRQLECWALSFVMNQEDSSVVLGITHQAVSKTLATVWDKICDKVA